MENPFKKILHNEEVPKALREKVINDIAKAADVTILNISKYKFEPQGFTILALLAESHISFHTFPEKGKCITILNRKSVRKLHCLERTNHPGFYWP